MKRLTVTPGTTIAEAARLPNAHGAKAPPVVARRARFPRA